MHLALQECFSAKLYVLSCMCMQLSVPTRMLSRELLEEMSWLCHPIVLVLSYVLQWVTSRSWPTVKALRWYCESKSILQSIGGNGCVA